MSSSKPENEATQRVDFHLTADPSQVDGQPTLCVPTNQVTIAGLSIADRKRRNRRKLFQCKHDPDLQHGLDTPERPVDLAALNLPVDWHFQRFLAKNGWYTSTSPRIVGFGIGDLTANPLRPSWDRSEREPLFFLKDEPIGDVDYSLLICQGCDSGVKFSIHHKIRVLSDGSLPPEVLSEIRGDLLWWAACPPLLIKGKFDRAAFAVLNYDLRQWIGFPKSDSDKALLREIYGTFLRHADWREAVRNALDGKTSPPAIYHSALGTTSDERLIIIHRVARPSELADELARMGCKDGILLDTGGSPFIWSNWAVSEGAVWACSSEFRPNRGAVVFLATQGERYRKRRSICRST